MHDFPQNFQLPSFLKSKIVKENGKTSISQIFMGKSVSMLHQNSTGIVSYHIDLTEKEKK